MKLIDKPNVGEYAPYAIMYIDLLPGDRRVLDHMSANLDVVRELVRDVPEDVLVTPCAPDEWTIKEILLHVIDDERIYACRALRFARGDATELPGFEQDEYVPVSNANARSIASLLDEYAAVRSATLTLFDNLDDAAFVRQGIANGHAMSVRAAAYHIAGHELHHIASIRQNYLPDA
jgi:uncharacterized damage-inducible protein DinB